MDKNKTFSHVMAGLALAALVVSLPLSALAQAPAPVDHSTMTPEQMRQHGPLPAEQTPAEQMPDHSKMTPEQMRQHGPLPAEQHQMTPEQMLEQTPEAAPPSSAPAQKKKP